MIAVPVSISEIVGLTFEQAKQWATEHSYRVVPSSIDGEATVLTQEFDPTRIQVALVDGKIKEVTNIG
jgi:hypothetical protein